MRKRSKVIAFLYLSCQRLNVHMCVEVPFILDKYVSCDSHTWIELNILIYIILSLFENFSEKNPQKSRSWERVVETGVFFQIERRLFCELMSNYVNAPELRIFLMAPFYISVLHILNDVLSIYMVLIVQKKMKFLNIIPLVRK